MPARYVAKSSFIALFFAMISAASAAESQSRPARRPGLPGPSWQRQATDVPRGVQAHRDLEYANVDGVSVKLDLYAPKNALRPLPLVVWIHGGGWRGGNKANCPALPLTTRGFIVASINYRLTDVAIWPAQIHDCQAAIRWLRANAKKYGIDPERIGVWGGSAGGHLVAMLGTSGGVKELEGGKGDLAYSSRVQSVCDWYGPSDFVAIAKLLNDAGRSSDAKNAVSRLLGGPIAENMDKAKQASPVTWISKDDPPFLIMHGDEDNVVPLSQSTILHEALKKAGVDSTFHVVKGAGHGQAGFARPEIHGMVARFFERTLELSEASSPTSRPD